MARSASRASRAARTLPRLMRRPCPPRPRGPKPPPNIGPGHHGPKWFPWRMRLWGPPGPRGPPLVPSRIAALPPGHRLRCVDDISSAGRAVRSGAGDLEAVQDVVGGLAVVGLLHPDPQAELAGLVPQAHLGDGRRADPAVGEPRDRPAQGLVGGRVVLRRRLRALRMGG